MARFRLQQADEELRIEEYLETKEWEEELERAEQRRREEEQREDKRRRKLNEIAQKRDLKLFRKWQEREEAEYEEQVLGKRISS